MACLLLFVGDKMFSSWSVRAALVLAESGAEYEERLFELDWPVRFEANRALPMPLSQMDEEPASGCICEVSQLLRADSSGLLASNFLSEIPRVPFLLDVAEDTIIGDAVAIAEYLAETFTEARTLIGNDRRRRAKIRTFVAHMHADYLPLMSGMSYSKSFRKGPKHHPTEPALRQSSILNRVMSRLLADNGGPYLFGEFSLGDIMVAPIVKAWTGWGHIQHTSKAVQRYAETAMFTRPSIAKAFADANSYYDRVRAMPEGSPAWIARHYRLNRDLGLIHNWRTDVFHELKNDSAMTLFERASAGASASELVSVLVDGFGADPAEAADDVRDFFASISPARDDELSGHDFYITPREVQPI